VVTNKLKTQSQSLEIGTAVQMGPARQSAHIPDGIQSFREGPLGMVGGYHLGDFTGGVATPHLDSEQLRISAILLAPSSTCVFQAEPEKARILVHRSERL